MMEQDIDKSSISVAFLRHPNTFIFSVPINWPKTTHIIPITPDIRCTKLLLVVA